MKKIIVFALSLILSVTALSTIVFAENYTVNDGEKEYIPQAYVYEKTLNILKDTKTASFNQPLDIYISEDDSIYVADTSNNRVIKLNTHGEVEAEFDSADGLRFNAPKGVCVTKEGEVYVADTGNGRIVRLSPDGETLNVFKKPESSLLSGIESYTPTKISVSPTGSGLYVLMGENIMNIDEENRVRGFVGQTDIGFDLTEWLVRVFATEEQQKNFEKRSSASYDNFHISADGLIYAVSRDTKEGQIKVLNTVGNNIYRKISTIENESNIIGSAISRFFTGNIISKIFSYGETEDGKPAVFTDICVNSDGIISAIQQQNGQIYQYDQSGNLLAVFGGLGTLQGEFAIPSSIATDSKGYIYVLDSSYGNIQIFRPTEFILNVQAAVTAHKNNDTQSSEKYWQKVLDTNDTYSLGYWGMGNAYYKKGEYKKAMECYEISGDRKEYSRAFAEYRFEVVEKNIKWVLLGAILLAASAYFIICFVSAKSRKMLHRLDYEEDFNYGFKQGCVIGIGVLFRPIQTFTSLKENRKKITSSSAVFILILTFVTRMFFVFTSSFAMRDIELNEVNILLEFVKLMLPIMTWVLASFLISEQFDGEATFKECFVTASYSMIPYIIVNTLAAISSHFLCWNEKGLFALMVNGVVLWCVVLMVLAVRTMNSYTVKNTAKVVFFTVFAIILVWFSVLLSYAVVARVFTLIGEVVNEFGLLFG